MAKFPWGQVIENISIPFNIGTMEVVKYHPWVYVNGRSTKNVDETKICYHYNSRSADTLESLVLYWLVEKKLGLNNEALVSGIARAIGL